MTRSHDIFDRVTPVGAIVSCRCGFHRTIKTRNALGRASAVRAAYREHDRQVDQEQLKGEQ